jgi:acyl carrier protein
MDKIRELVLEELEAEFVLDVEKESYPEKLQLSKIGMDCRDRRDFCQNMAYALGIYIPPEVEDALDTIGDLIEAVKTGWEELPSKAEEIVEANQIIQEQTERITAALRSSSPKKTYDYRIGKLHNE